VKIKFKEPICWEWVVGIDIGRKRTGTFSGELSGLCGKRGSGSLHPCAMEMDDIGCAKMNWPITWFLASFYLLCITYISMLFMWVHGFLRSQAASEFDVATQTLTSEGDKDQVVACLLFFRVIWDSYFKLVTQREPISDITLLPPSSLFTIKTLDLTKTIKKKIVTNINLIYRLKNCKRLHLLIRKKKKKIQTNIK